MQSFRTSFRILIAITFFAARACAEGPAANSSQVILDLAAQPFQVSQITTKEKKKVPAGAAELVDGKFGKAINFTFVDGAQGGFITARVKPDADWDKADGFSFWVKGDGSKSFGGIEIIDRSDYVLRYAYCFPIDSTEWRKIVVPWHDLIPELSSPIIDAKTGYAPSKFGSFAFGKWFFWRDYPANSFTIDRIALEPKIEAQPPVAVPSGLGRVRAKLEQHKPVTIVTMGDSLTDEHHWSNRKTVWHHLLSETMKTKFGGDVKIINPAIGGTTLSQNIILMPRWESEAPAPDLVAVWFGGNDWESKVRGPRFAEYLRAAVDRIREQTHGNADILLMTTCPGYANWETRKELEQAVRHVAREKQTGYADIAGAFRAAGSADEAMKKEYWASDKVHLGSGGHALTSEIVLHAIEKGD